MMLSASGSAGASRADAREICKRYRTNAERAIEYGVDKRFAGRDSAV
jgi:hypothetical protein